MNIPHEKHVLDNGLEVLLHQDRTDPLVAVYVTYHVGSSRERRGLSGFAHLFEHMLFQGSQNVPEGEFFRRIQAAGGTLNGSTNQDRTNYYEVLPAGSLELALFLEADRMGRLLPAMTQAKLDNQRDVVKNEKRQSYDNRPYGRVHELVLGTLFPPEHPYSWPTIGSMEDIDRATLEDISAFFRRWYGPNNATLAIGGDFDRDEALALVEKHFGDLVPCPSVESPAPEPARLEQAVHVVQEDRIRLPQLSLVWPTVHAWHPDEPALNLLADALSANKASLLDRVLVLEERLASYVTIWPQAGERAGFLRVDLRPTPEHDLDRLETRVDELLARFVAEGVDAERLERLKVRREGAIVRSLESVAARTNLLSHYNCFHRDPDRLEADLERHRRVSAADVLGVAERWILGRPRISLSAVPEGRPELAASPRTLRAPARASHPTALPAPATDVAARGPAPWRASLSAGVPLLGTRFQGVPLARLSVSLNAGRLGEVADTRGLASLCAELLDEGTERLSSTAWTDALDGLGATLSVRPGNDELILTLTALEDRLDESVEVLAELVRGPRFAPEDFERARGLRLVAIDTLPDRAPQLAEEVFRGLLHGRDTAMGAPLLGTRASIEALELDDVHAFWRAGGGRGGAQLAYVGSRSPDEVCALLEPWCGWWRATAAPSGDAPLEEAPRAGLRITLVPKPGAPQAELRVGHPSVARRHPDFDPLRALNHLIGGSFTSRLNLNLREDKGYTYGVRSSFVGGLGPGRFYVATAVDTANAVAALREILAELRGLHEGLRPDEVDFARTSLAQALALAYESTAAKLGLLERTAKYGLPDDYVARRHTWLRTMTPEVLDDLARRHVRADALDVLIVGDADALVAELEELAPVTVLAADGS